MALLMDELVDVLNARCDRQPYITRWHLHDLTSGAIAGRSAHVVGPSASTRKIPILLAALAEVRAGRWSLSDPLSPDPSYQRDDSGCFHQFAPGFTLPLIDHLTMMIIVSDNTSTGMLVDMLGLDRVNEYTQRLGMTNTRHRDGIPSPELPWNHPPDATNATTAADMGHLLARIQRASLGLGVAREMGLATEDCQLALKLLHGQKVGNMLPYLLPPTARVGHKTGTGVRDHADVGIISGENAHFIFAAFCDYVPTVLPDGQGGKGAAQLHIARLAKTCWDFFYDPFRSTRPRGWPNEQ